MNSHLKYINASHCNFVGFAQVCRGCWADALHPHGLMLRYSGRLSRHFLFRDRTNGDGAIPFRGAPIDVEKTEGNAVRFGLVVRIDGR